MKKLWIFALLAAALIARPTAAKAGDEVWAAVGGVIGGIVLSEVFEGDRDHPKHHVRGGHCRHGKAFKHCGRCGPEVKIVIRGDRGRHHARRGHYEVREHRKWIPGHWVYEDRGCGRRSKYWEPGRYVVVKKRVWVPHHRGPYGKHNHRRDRCRP